MTIHVVLRVLCLLLFICVAVKQYRTLKEHENGAKALRKKLLGITMAFIVLSIGSIIFLLNNFADILPPDHVVAIYTAGLVTIAAIWFYIYYVKQ
jgi:hypothetical protein